MIYVRLVRHDDPLSWAIIQNIGGVVAHAEAVMKGGTVIGAFAAGNRPTKVAAQGGNSTCLRTLFVSLCQVRNVTIQVGFCCRS